MSDTTNVCCIVSSTGCLARLAPRFAPRLGADKAYPSPNYISRLDRSLALHDYSSSLLQKFLLTSVASVMPSTSNEGTGSGAEGVNITKEILKTHKELIDDGFYLGNVSTLDKVIIA